MQVKGLITFAGKNDKGWYTVTVKVDNKPVYIGFGIKQDTHQLNGITIEKGMIFEGEVDENAYNKFVSGKVYKSGGGNKSSGGKSGGYDTIGNAMGGAVNRANALVAAGIIHPNSLIENSLSQYMASEMCVEAAKNKRAKELYDLAGKMDTTNFMLVYQTYVQFMTGKTVETPKQEAPKPEPKPEPKQEAPVQTPEDFGAGDSEFEDEVPF